MRLVPNRLGLLAAEFGIAVFTVAIHKMKRTM